MGSEGRGITRRLSSSVVPYLKRNSESDEFGGYGACASLVTRCLRTGLHPCAPLRGLGIAARGGPHRESDALLGFPNASPRWGFSGRCRYVNPWFAPWASMRRHYVA